MVSNGGLRIFRFCHGHFHGHGSVRLDSGQWVEMRLQFPTSGRYASEVVASASAEGSELWIEDYVDNPDGRTYNVTGALRIPKGDSLNTVSVDGSPLRADTLHPMRIHSRKNGIQLHMATFTLLREHRSSKRIMTQSMEGSQWELVWSDEFETEQIDTSKWTYDLGNWGWGNNELQYYTEGREENARTEKGSYYRGKKERERSGLDIGPPNHPRESGLSLWQDRTQGQGAPPAWKLGSGLDLGKCLCR